jgi:hypothetical protein
MVGCVLRVAGHAQLLLRKNFSIFLSSSFLDRLPGHPSTIWPFFTQKIIGMANNENF